MSGSYATPLQLDFVPSHRLALALAALHGGALMLLPFTGLAAGYQLLLAPLLGVAGWYAWRDCPAIIPGRFIRRLCWDRADHIELCRRDGSRATLRLQPDACVTPWLVVLRLCDAGGRTVHLPVLPDMLPPGQFRRLRVRLRLEIPRLAATRP